MIEDSNAQARFPYRMSEMDRVLDELFASECPHDHTDEIPCRVCTRAALAAAEERGRRAGIEAMQLGTCRVYRHGCADGRAIENRMADRWREYALPHPKRDNCLEWVALAPRDSGKDHEGELRAAVERKP